MSKSARISGESYSDRTKFSFPRCLSSPNKNALLPRLVRLNLATINKRKGGQGTGSMCIRKLANEQHFQFRLSLTPHKNRRRGGVPISMGDSEARFVCLLGWACCGFFVFRWVAWHFFFFAAQPQIGWGLGRKQINTPARSARFTRFKRHRQAQFREFLFRINEAFHTRSHELGHEQWEVDVLVRILVSFLCLLLCCPGTKGTREAWPESGRVTI